MKAMVLHECVTRDLSHWAGVDALEGVSPRPRLDQSRPNCVQDAICWPLEWCSVSSKDYSILRMRVAGGDNHALARASQDALAPTSKETTLHDYAGRATTRCRAYSARSRPSVGLWGTKVNFVRGESSVEDATLAA